MGKLLYPHNIVVALTFITSDDDGDDCECSETVMVSPTTTYGSDWDAAEDAVDTMTDAELVGELLTQHPHYLEYKEPRITKKEVKDYQVSEDYPEE